MCAAHALLVTGWPSVGAIALSAIATLTSCDNIGATLAPFVCAVRVCAAAKSGVVSQNQGRAAALPEAGPWLAPFQLWGLFYARRNARKPTADEIVNLNQVRSICAWDNPGIAAPTT